MVKEMKSFKDLSHEQGQRELKSDDQVAHGLMIAIEKTMKEGVKFKNEGLEDDGNPPNGYSDGQQVDRALDKIKWKVPSFKRESDRNMFHDWERQVENLFMVRDHSDSVKAKKVYLTWIQEVLRLARGRMESIQVLLKAKGDQQELTTSPDIINGDTISRSDFEYNEMERRWIVRSGLSRREDFGHQCTKPTRHLGKAIAEEEEEEAEGEEAEGGNEEYDKFDSSIRAILEQMQIRQT
ncbi:hypothetical protein M9H77_07788 [Catharanthus roseus]|uniref:Uncharacterized protein n=1 Tax=Catharanthus roseus TaxID=4058 RepID=A0ACC0BVX9_CATRO|nr:hypothetical protein M9H77_07788 [Catharanthus roseus]